MPVLGRGAASELVRGVRALLRDPGLLRGLARRERWAEVADRLLRSRGSEAAGRSRRAQKVDDGLAGPEATGSEASEGREDLPEAHKKVRRTPEQKEEVWRIEVELSRKRKEHRQLSRALRASMSSGDPPRVFRKLMAQVKSSKQEMFLLERRLHTSKEGVGALPDFIIIGAPKCGTTFLYHLLAKHPYVQPAAFKEIHYFDILHHKGEEWYRRCFPAPRQKDGHKTITGEATPGYLAFPEAPARMAAIAPQAKLIALLRNPVDRVYSGYHFFRSRQGRDTHEFDDHVRAALKNPRRKKLLSQGVYVDQLAAWSEFFAREQMLVLKSEDFFEEPQRTLGVVLDFLELPAWEPDASELGQKRNKGSYEGGMGQETRRKLEEYYASHNQRLYAFLGEDFGWGRW